MVVMHWAFLAMVCLFDQPQGRMHALLIPIHHPSRSWACACLPSFGDPARLPGVIA